MHSISRRSLLAATAAAAFTPAGWTQSAAYPSKPLSLIVPYPAGGPSDASARIFAEPIGRVLKQQIIIDNLGGATGMLGARKVLAAAPDGYTFLYGSANEVILAPLLNTAAKYQPSDFKLVQSTTEATIVLLVRDGFGINTLDEFVVHAQKNKAKPLTFATAGIDSLYHLMGEAMAKRIGANFLHVPYKGAAPAIQDLAGGQIDFAILPYQASMDGIAGQGRMKLVTSFSRSLPAALKHVPKLDLSKLLPDFEYSIGSGFLVRKDTPGGIVDSLRAAVGHALVRPEIRARLEGEGKTVLQPLATQNAADAHLLAQINRYTRLLKDIDRRPTSS